MAGKGTTGSSARSRSGARHRIGLLAGAVTVLAVLLVVVSAWAVALAPQGCTDDNDPPQGADTCARSTDGLDAAKSVAISPDGKSVYVAGQYDDAIVRFARDTLTGALTTQGCFYDNSPSAGADSCGQSAQGLWGVRSVAMSPDGKSLYAASWVDDAVVRFDRDTATGALSWQGCVDNASLGAPCPAHAAGLEGASAVTVSPDGKSVYAVSGSGDAVVHFDRDASTGALTAQGCVADDDSGDTDCTQQADGLDGAVFVTVSPDGKSVYVASEDDDAIVSFDRDTSTGALTPQGCVDDVADSTGEDACGQTSAGLAGAESVTVSPDGKSVYAATGTDWAIVRFDRNTTTGALSPQGCIGAYSSSGCGQTTTGLSHASGVAVSPDNAAVYVASWTSDAVVSFARDPASGALLLPASCVGDDDSGPAGCGAKTDGLDGATSIALSPNGQSAYVASFWDDAVVRLNVAPDTPPVAAEDVTATVGGNPVRQSVDSSTGLAWLFMGAADSGTATQVTFPIDGGGGTVSNVSLVLVERNGTQHVVAMSNPSGNVWTGTVSARTGNLYVSYDLTVGTETKSFVVPVGGLVLIDPQGIVYDEAAFDAAVAAGSTPAEARAAAALPGATVQLERETDGAFAGVHPGDPGIAPQMNPQVTLADGVYQWDVVAGTYRVTVTKAGYRSATTQAVEIPPPVIDLHVPLADTVEPETTITSGPSKKTRSHKAVFEFQSSDPLSSFKCKLDAKPLEGCSTPQTYKRLKHGKHAFQVRAKDSVGNVDASAAKRSWTIKR